MLGLCALSRVASAPLTLAVQRCAAVWRLYGVTQLACGSIIRGQRLALLMMIAFSMLTVSDGRPAIVQARTCMPRIEASGMSDLHHTGMHMRLCSNRVCGMHVLLADTAMARPAATSLPGQDLPVFV